MTVYFMRHGDDGLIKIGYVIFPNNIRRRRYALQLECEKPIEILALMDGWRQEEKAVHERFGHLRVRGEWFSAATDLLEFCAENPPEAYMSANGMKLPAPARVLPNRWKPVEVRIPPELHDRMKVACEYRRMASNSILIPAIEAMVDEIERQMEEDARGRPHRQEPKP